MPKTKLGRKPVDEVKGYILERKTASGKTYEDLGKIIGVSDSTMRRMFSAGTATWRVCDLFTLTSALDIPKDKVRAAL